MHICFIGEIATANVKTGGIGTFVANIIPELIKLDCRVSVISYKKQQKAIEIEDANGFKIYWINTHQWGRLRTLKKLIDTNRLIGKININQPIDVIDAAENGLFKIKKRKNILYVVRMNGGHLFFSHSTTDTPFNSKTAFVERNSLSKADAIIGVSNYVLDTTLGYYPWLKKLPSKIIPNPIIVEHFYASNPEKSVSGKILFYGSLTEKKGIRQLIEAIPKVLAECNNAELFIYGRDIAIRPSGHSYKALLEKLVDELKLKNVHFMDAVPNHEMPKIIESAHIVVLPSHMEAMPLAWLEALAMAKPFIGSIKGPGPEVITPGVNGLLCDPLNPTDIAEKIIFMLQNEDAAKGMGMEARKHTMIHYNSTHLAKLNKQFYIQCTNNYKANANCLNLFFS